MTQTPKPQPLAPRVLGDDTLVVFVSDTHIGGDVGHTIFETPAGLAALFDELARHAGPVELMRVTSLIFCCSAVFLREKTGRRRRSRGPNTGRLLRL